ATIAQKEEKIEMTGEIVEALRNGMFRISLDNGHQTLGYTAGKMRRFRIRMNPGDRVRIELSPYDLDRGRIVYRLRPGDERDSRSPRLEDARFCVFDLETTGLATASARICEIGAVRVERLALADTFQTLVRPGVPLPRPIGALTGLPEAELARAPKIASALRRFASFAGDAVLVAHNARFDTAFVNRELERLTGKRHAGPVIDTVSLARNLLRGRAERTGLA